MHPSAIALICCLAATSVSWSFASDQPQWGQAWSRNMVSREKRLTDSFNPKTGDNIKWTAKLGTETHSTPIVAGGRVYIGTNNGEPRDSQHQGDRGVFMCFDEKTGSFLWQLVVPKREEDDYFDWPKTGIASPATVEGDRVYVVSNRGEVMCLDARGMENGNSGPYRDEAAHMVSKKAEGSASKTGSATPAATPTLGPSDADIIWLFDLTTGAGIWSHDAAHSSILIQGNYLYLNTGTGVDRTHKRIRTPDAPSLVVLDKRTGRLVAREDEHMAPNIFHNTWSSPSLAEIGGNSVLCFAGGNGVLYGIEPLSANTSLSDSSQLLKLKSKWQFVFDSAAPREEVHKYNSNRREGPSNFYAMPVVVDGRVFLAGGGDLWWGKNEAWLKCIKPEGTGDITATSLVWSYPLQKHVLSTPAISEGLLFIADCGRAFHCVDAQTGKPLWTHDINGEVWASPLVADGKVYLGTRLGNFYVFAASKEKRLLTELELGAPMSATVTAANGVLYVATMTHLYAVQASKR